MTSMICGIYAGAVIVLFFFLSVGAWIYICCNNNAWPIIIRRFIIFHLMGNISARMSDSICFFFIHFILLHKTTECCAGEAVLLKRRITL